MQDQLGYINMAHNRPSGDVEMNPAIYTSAAVEHGTGRVSSTGDLLQQGKVAQQMINQAKLNILAKVAQGGK